MKKPKAKTSSDWKEVCSGEEADIFATLSEKTGTSLFLGRYTMTEVLAVLEKRNFLKEAQKRNLWPFVFDLDSTEFPLQRFRIFFERKRPEKTIVDLKIKEGIYRPPKNISSWFPLPECRLIILEWLTLQNPLLSFSEERTPLPGQEHPGLSLGKKVLDIFVYLARLTRKDGILAFPAYFHNALLFGRYFHFINPDKEGEILEIRKSFPDIPFKQLAWIVYLNCMKNGKGKAYEWVAEEQLYPLHKALKSYFTSRKYQEEVEKSQNGLSFTVDWECFARKKAEENLRI